MLLLAVLALAGASVGCHRPVTEPRLPDVAPAEDAPTLRPSPTPPGREGDVPGPPVVKP